ncbi:uncharacterized protein CDV56_104249 [Aspergillus thermomutatus]|uniref:Cadmium resistance transporter n=1 Tax=Aspergillus thermomutatus TaxID=41047 RepID=A0A397GQJ8_ASPTH|nr:uncharacterized protein CDV56_104249 [Aspergillus thermomutatus]RHZ51794.1 hypothetical protein CDV56_104249 [Aspergillus thermomutatus]
MPWPGFGYNGTGAGAQPFQGFFNRSSSGPPIPLNAAKALLLQADLVTKTPKRVEAQGSSPDGFAVLAGRSADNKTVQVLLNNYKFDYDIALEITPQIVPSLNTSTTAYPLLQDNGLMNGESACFVTGACLTFPQPTWRNNTSQSYHLKLVNLPWKKTDSYKLEVRRVADADAEDVYLAKQGRGNVIAAIHLDSISLPVNAAITALLPIMQFGKSLGAACGSFAITNIDDMFVLVTFFAEASASRTVTPLKITAGQYLGFTVIIIISMIGFGASLLIPAEPIGFLGLLPILLGIWKFFDLLFPEEEDEEESEKSKIAGVKSILKVSAITVMNGGDNIGTYIPLFAQAKGAEIAVYIVTYYILVGVWCLVAFLVMKQKHILLVAERYASVVVPFLYLGLGVYIVVKSSCYPWSIQHIDDSTSAHPGKTIMAVVTTVLLLICIGAMLWCKLRKKAAQPPDSNTSQEDSPSPIAEGELEGSHTPT